MKTIFKTQAKSLLLAGAALAAFSTGAFAQSQETDIAPEFTEPTIEFAAAAEIAANNADGAIVDMSLEYPDENPVYVATLEGDLSFSALMIDAVTGEVLASHVSKAISEEYLDLMFEGMEDEEMLLEAMLDEHALEFLGEMTDAYFEEEGEFEDEGDFDHVDDDHVEAEDEVVNEQASQ